MYVQILFGKHFLTSPYVGYSNERVGDVIASQFVPYILAHEIVLVNLKTFQKYFSRYR